MTMIIPETAAFEMTDQQSQVTLFLTYGRPEDLPVHRMPALLEMALAFWQDRAAGRRAPTERDIAAVVHMPEIASATMLWKVTRDEHGYVCTFAGSAVCEMGGHDLHGIELAEMPWDEPDELRHEFDSVAETLLPHYVERSVSVPRERHG